MSREFFNFLSWPICYLKGWRKILDYKGVCSRAEYSKFLGVNFLIVIALLWISIRKAFLCGFWIENYLFVYLILSVLPLTAISVRRLNDAGEPLSALLSRRSLNNSSLGTYEKAEWSTLFLTESLPHLAWNTLPLFAWRAAKGIWKFFLYFCFFPVPVPFPPFIMPGGLVFFLLAILAAIAIPAFNDLAVRSGGDVAIGLNNICSNPWF